MVNAEKIFKYLIISGIFLLLLTPLIVANSMFFPFITGKAFFFRIIVEIIFAFWLCLLLFRKSNFPSTSTLLWGLLALVGITTLATVFGVNPYRSFWSNFERMEGLITHLHLLAYFVVLISVFKNHRLWLWFFRTSVAVATIVGIYGIFQLLGWLTIHQGGVRVDATLGNSAYLAVYLLIHVFITLWLIYRDWSQRSVVYFYSAMLLIQLINLYYTATRGALIGLVGGLILTLLLIVWRAKDAVKLKKVSLSILIAIAILLVGFWLARGSDLIRSSSVLSRFSSISFEEIKSEARLSIWQISLAGFKERPVIGWGPENFVTIFSKYFRPELWTQEPWFDRSHNIFLDWLNHTGILGLLAYLSLFASAIYYLWHPRTDFLVLESSVLTGLLAAYFIHNIFVFDNLVSYLLFFSVLAYIHFRSNNQPTEVSIKTNHAWSQPVFLLAGIVVVVLLPLSLYYFNVKPILASQTLIKTFQTGDPNKKLLLFEQSLAYKTFGNGEISEQLFTTALSALRTEGLSVVDKEKIVQAALVQLAEQVTTTPNEVRPRLFYGALLSQVGQVEQAIVQLEVARKLAPNKQQVLLELIRAYSLAGNKNKALELVEFTYKLDTDYSEARKAYINALADADKYKLLPDLWAEQVKVEPHVPDYWFSWAASLFTVGDKTKSLTILEEAKQKFPEIATEIDKLIKDIKAGKNPLTNK